MPCDASICQYHMVSDSKTFARVAVEKKDWTASRLSRPIADIMDDELESYLSFGHRIGCIVAAENSFIQAPDFGNQDASHIAN